MNAVWIVGGGVPDLQTAAIQALSRCDTWVPMAAALFSPAQVGCEGSLAVQTTRILQTSYSLGHVLASK